MAHENKTRFLNTDPRGESRGTKDRYGKSTDRGALGYAHKDAFKNQDAERNKARVRLTYRQAKGAKGTKQWSYGELTSEEREDYKVKHGIAPTAADPSKLGIATRAKAKADKAKGELTDKDKKAQGVVETREADKAKYKADAVAAGWARMKAGSIAHRKANKAKYSAMSNAWEKAFGGRSTPKSSNASFSSRTNSRRTVPSSRGIKSSGRGAATRAGASSNFGFSGNTGTVGFGNLSSSYGKM